MISFDKRVHRFRTFGQGAVHLVRSIKTRRDIIRQHRVDAALLDQIELVVSRVNGCRLCTYVHAAQALQDGVSELDLEQLLALELGHFPPERAVALAFAEHFAESEGQPDSTATQRFRDYYGPAMSQDILTYLQYIQFGSLNGATLDAFLQRLRGHPVHGSHIATELMVGLLAGPLMLPKLAWAERSAAYARVRAAMDRARRSG